MTTCALLMGKVQTREGTAEMSQLLKRGADLCAPASTRHWLWAAPGSGWQPLPLGGSCHWYRARTWRRKELGAFSSHPAHGGWVHWVKRAGVGWQLYLLYLLCLGHYLPSWYLPTLQRVAVLCLAFSIHG